eukprot:TRINITY_DN26230_c0_g1_i1.p1 TRINITY_DN26230_c0_g1~~TRINITY_DN26230_c0_g1_i1.p1  ORF type:complete len:106 (-),score=29.09 TRINITY_DN26230_c0_g1_i1:229-546(-)
MEASKVYRDMLKAVRKHIGKDGPKLHFQDYIKEEFRKSKYIEDSSVLQQKLKLAHNYASLLNSVHHHKDLLFSYNIAIDREAEKKSVIEKSAKRVGLKLPKSYME